MTTSSSSTRVDPPREAFVWVWLPGGGGAGRCRPSRAVRGTSSVFNYGRSYLEPRRRHPAVPPGAAAAGRRDRAAGRVARSQAASRTQGRTRGASASVVRSLLGEGEQDADPAQLDTLTYLMRSGSDRIGALDFQESATVYVAATRRPRRWMSWSRRPTGSIVGCPSPALDRALLHGSSSGGARPKALLDDALPTAAYPTATRRLIAKLVLDNRHLPGGARRVRGHAARSPRRHRRRPERGVVGARPEEVLLVERFDRVPGTAAANDGVSALTILGLDEMLARYATYVELAEVVRERFTDAEATLASCSRASRSTSASATSTTTPATTRRSGTARRSR